MKPRVLIVLLFLFGLACATPQAMMDSWIGKTKQELILKWGPPDRTDSDGNGGEVLTYGQVVTTGQTPGVIQQNQFGDGVTYTAPQVNSYMRLRQFYVNSAGVIYAHRWHGL